jgi:asparagine synthase (glutamine-hydrolysing)
MAHGLEVRSPLLDHRIVEFACALGNNWKIHNGTTKYLLRHAYRASLPDDILRRKKHGFDVPIGAWFRHELKDLFADTVINAACPSYLKRSEITKIWNAHQKQRGDYGVKLWTILVYFLWLAKRTA